MANANSLLAPVSNEVIKNAIFSMHSDKSLGPDGFSPGFFKHSWNIIHEDFCAAIHEFFDTGKLLKEINSTFISIIPKKANVNHVGQFCPISLCNVVYKTITKIMANRLKLVID